MDDGNLLVPATRDQVVIEKKKEKTAWKKKSNQHSTAPTHFPKFRPELRINQFVFFFNVLFVRWLASVQNSVDKASGRQKKTNKSETSFQKYKGNHLVFFPLDSENPCHRWVNYKSRANDSKLVESIVRYGCKYWTDFIQPKILKKRTCNAAATFFF